MRSPVFSWMLVAVCMGTMTLTAPAAESWPALAQLDALIVEVDALDAKARRDALKNVTEMLDQLTLKAAPKAFKENLVARFLVGDLESINAKLKKPEALTDAEVSDLTGSLHPLLDALLEEMKVPHACNHTHHDDHDDHDGHDHDGHEH